MKVAVTGGSGQLGTVVVRRLVADRSVERVAVLDVRPPIVASRKVAFVQADVRDAGIGRHFEGFDAVLHLAFLVTRAAPRDVFQAVNVEGSKNVIRGAATAGVATVVYASSVAAYGVLPGHPDPIVEETPRRYHATFPYAAAKFEVEAFLDDFEPAHPEMAICRLRPVVLAGRRMEHALGQALRAGLMPDSGPQAIPIVWDEDVAQAAVLAMQRRARGAFLLSAEDPLPAAGIAAAGGLRRVPIPIGALRRGARLSQRLGLLKDDPSWVDLEPVEMRVSTRRAREELGWRPKYPTARDVARALGAAALGRADPRVALFLRLAALGFEEATAGRADAKRLSAEVHLELTGRGGSDTTLSFGEGRLRVASGVPRPPTSVISIAMPAMLDLLAGRLSPATAQLTGKIRLEGEPIAMLMVNGMVSAFREEVAKPGARGFAARQLARWIAR